MAEQTPTTQNSAAEHFIQSQTGPTVPYDRDAIYTHLETFTRDNEEFQSGLEAILGPLTANGATPEQLDQTKQRAKVFFFMSKTGTEVDYDDYVLWLSSRPETSPSTTTTTTGAVEPTTTTTEPYPASFDSIVELIATGQTDKIAGIRDIPLKINEDEPTKPSLEKPLKPWEKKGENAETQ